MTYLTKALPSILCIQLITGCSPEEIDYSSLGSATSTTTASGILSNANDEATLLSSWISHDGTETGSLADPIEISWDETFELNWDIDSTTDNSIEFRVATSLASYTETTSPPILQTISSCEVGQSCNSDKNECTLSLSDDQTPQIRCEYTVVETDSVVGNNLGLTFLPGIDDLDSFPAEFQVVASVCKTSDSTACDIARIGFIKVVYP